VELSSDSRGECLAAAAGVFATNVTMHKKLGWDAIQLLADLLADVLQGMPQGAQCGLNFVIVD
jgi:hypothetical protein